MAQLKDNYQLLIEQLDQFTRKYYVNQAIRGSLYALALILALFLSLNFAEYIGYFPATTRRVLFWSFVGVSAASLWAWIGVPMMHYFRLGKIISHEQAASIIGAHFGNVQDKLLNILQLRKQASSLSEGRELILASINQKSEEIRPVPFQSAIDLYQNRKYVRYALPPLLLLLFVLFAAPSLLKNASARLFNYDKNYERDAPFHFSFDKDKLKVVQFQDYDLTVKVDGALLPNDVFLSINGYEYRMTKLDATTYAYKFSNVQQDVPFSIFAGRVKTPQYTLAVLKKPNVAGFEVKLDYPEYTGRADEMIANSGDLIVPQGTNLTWLFNALNTDEIRLQFGKQAPQTIARQGETNFYFAKKIMTDEPYKLYVSNHFLPNADSIAYTITVVPDLHPTINVEKLIDSLNRKRLFFVGDASDDYGLQRLSFNYQIKRASASAADAMQRILLPQPSNKSTPFQYTFDTESLKLSAGDEVTYFFEVFDNDAVNGSKSARTNTMTFALPTEKEMEQKMTKNNEEIKTDLKKAIEEAKKIQEDTKKLREHLLQKKYIDFKMKKQAENLQKRQEQLDKQIEKAKENFKENLETQRELNKQDEEVLKKQEQLEKMFDELQNPEMKELMKQIEEMMQKMDKDQALEKLEEAKLSNEELQKELDRMKETFKQMEVESEMKAQIEKLEELAKKQEDAAKDSEQDKKSQEELKKEQDELNKEFKDLKEQQKETEKKNQELERPNKTPDTKEEQKDVEQEQQDAKEQLQQKQNAKASKAQKKAADKMKNMANKMKQGMAQDQAEQEEEDLKAMRQLLENLVNLSFDQEALIKDFDKTSEQTPRFVKLTQQQKKLRDDFTMIEDSLQALSKRVSQIQTFVTEKVTEVKSNLRESLAKLEDRKKFEAAENQQRTMKNVNDLALMLSESMSQMQEQMKSQMPGNGSCDKPGGKNPKKGKNGKKPSDKMGEGQKSLNQQMQDLKKRMEGNGGKDGKNGMSKEFAQMAAKQAAMRNALRQKQKELQERGKGDKALQGIMDNMDKTETELVNKTLTSETIRRQQEILTKLLEHERAEQERDQDDERKADVAKQQQQATPPAIQEYIKKRQAEIEQYKTVSPSLKPYYKTLVEDYYRNLKGGK